MVIVVDGPTSFRPPELIGGRYMSVCRFSKISGGAQKTCRCFPLRSRAGHGFHDERIVALSANVVRAVRRHEEGI